MSDTLMDFDEAVRRYDPVLGLEVHVELGTATKMSDATPNIFGVQPNTMMTPTLVGPPGALPAVNARGVGYAVRIGLVLGCEIVQSCRLARKNYFYPDLVKNFQTSQSDESTVYDGVLEIETEDGSFLTIPIGRAHMEEDTGKNIHIGGVNGRIEGASHSLVDYSRVGVPLVEVVTRPIEGTGTRASQVAAAYVRTLRDIFRALGVSEMRMECGNVRADVNISLRESPDAPLGIRTEAKNANTSRGIEQVVRYEIQHQVATLATGGEVFQETRHSQIDGTTRAGRVGSDVDNYRYFPESDLVLVMPSHEWVEEVRAGLPEMPAAKCCRPRVEWSLNDTEMRDVINAGALELIETTVAAGTTGQVARKWWTGEPSRTVKKQETALEDMAVTPEQIAELQGMVNSGRLTDKLTRQVLEGILAGEGDPEVVAAARGPEVVPDDPALLAVMDEALAANPDVTDKIRGGKVQAVGVTVGAVMKVTCGQADVKRVRKLVMERA